MNMLPIIIILPLIGFVVLAFSNNRYSENLSATIGVSSIGLAALMTGYVGIDFFNNKAQPFTVPLWSWISVNDFNIDFNLALDSLSFVMIFMITGVGFLIHMFAAWYMRGKEGYSQFFAYINLFISSMLLLVLADNLLLMYLGWESVGLCSYLLIGFYHTDLKNSEAAMKAFIMTRVGDVFLIFALFIFYNELGTLNFREIAELAPAYFKVGNKMLWWATLMLLFGSVGKSAQLPLQTWLPDAMVGPTPVSALIHAATMVTSGVYLIARTHSLFLMTPDILYLIAIIGASTLVLASFAALVQTDIKRILAYSTMSQVGYMFLGLGVKAWTAAIYHLIIHAFFKALLFLSSGSVILSCEHEQNIFKMGGLYKPIPLVYSCFLAGGASLAAVPLITAGYFSKDKILAGAMINGNINLIAAGLLGAFMSSLYIFRMIFIVFHGKEKILPRVEKGILHHLPLITLLILSSFLGPLIIPPLEALFPDIGELEKDRVLMLKVISGLLSIAGILIAAWLWLYKSKLLTGITNSAPGRLLRTWCYQGWGFDQFYNLIFVKPFLNIATVLHYDPLNALMNIPVLFFRLLSKGLIFSENGYLRWYLASINIGALSLLVFLILLH